MPLVNLPNIRNDAASDQQNIQYLTDAYYKLRKELAFLLGNLDRDNVVEAQSVVADWVYAGNIVTDQIVAGEAKISVALIEDLIVGGNVAMGPDATISWGQVTDAPSYIKSTYIDSTTVQSPTIIGGSITGGIVQTADTSYKRIVVDTSGITSYDGSYKNGFYAKAGTYSEGALGINHNGVSVMSMNWNGQGHGLFACGGDLKIQAGGGSYKTYFVGNVDFSDATISGHGFASDDHSHTEYADISHSHSGYATTLWVTNRFARDDHLHSGYYLTIDSFNTEMAEHIANYHP